MIHHARQGSNGRGSLTQNSSSFKEQICTAVTSAHNRKPWPWTRIKKGRNLLQSMCDLPSADNAYKACIVRSERDIWSFTDTDTVDSFPRRSVPRLYELYCCSGSLRFQAVWPSPLWCHLIFFLLVLFSADCLDCVKPRRPLPHRSVHVPLAAPCFQTHLSNSSSRVRNASLYRVSKQRRHFFLRVLSAQSMGLWLRPTRQNTHLACMHAGLSGDFS